jgi:hypothetical protein
MPEQRIPLENSAGSFDTNALERRRRRLHLPIAGNRERQIEVPFFVRVAAVDLNPHS